jgi:arsenate reductase
MGCGVECPALSMDDDWGLEDPVGRGEAFYRKTLEEIKQRLIALD